MTSLPEALAIFLQSRGLGSYRASGLPFGDSEWAIVLEVMPATPDKVITISQYEGVESDSKLAWDQPRVQVRVRGTKDPSDSRNMLQEIYDLLHGLGPQTLSMVRVQLVIGLGSGPGILGVDNNQRFEHVANFEVTVFNPNRRD